MRLRKADDTHVTLKRADGGGWFVGERDWPAQVSKVRKLLLDLDALNVVEEKTRLPVNYPALGVEDLSTPKATGTEVMVLSPAQKWTLIVGKPSGGKSGYVRVAGAEKSLLAAPLSCRARTRKAGSRRPSSTCRPSGCARSRNDPAEGAAYSVARQKKEDPHFTLSALPKGRELSGPGAADSLAAALAGLTLEDVTRAATAGAPAAARAVFRTFDDLEVEVSGRKDGARSLVTLVARAAQGTARGRSAAPAVAPGGLGVRDSGLQVRGDLSAADGPFEAAAGTEAEVGQAREGGDGAPATDFVAPISTRSAPRRLSLSRARASPAPAAQTGGLPGH